MTFLQALISLSPLLGDKALADLGIVAFFSVAGLLNGSCDDYRAVAVRRLCQALSDIVKSDTGLGAVLRQHRDIPTLKL
jgi:hypothetical protein